MIIEMQIRTERFAAAFRERLREQVACRVFDFTLGGVSHWVIGYEIGPTVIRRGQKATANGCVRATSILDQQHISYRPVQIVQTLKPKVCKHDDFVAANGNACATFQLNIELVFEVAMDSCGWWNDITFTFVNDGTSPQADFLAAFGMTFPQVRNPLPFAQMLSGMPGVGSPMIINAQVSLSQGSGAIAIRAESWDPVAISQGTDSLRGLAYWQTFVNGTLVEHLHGGGAQRDWSIFVQNDFIVPAVRDMIESELSAASDMRLHGSVNASWENHSGTPRINISFNADAIDACRCFTKEIDVNADIKLDVDLSVQPDNMLQQDAYIDVDTNFWDALCCSVTGALFWPLVGAELLKKDKLKWYAYLGGIGALLISPLSVFGIFVVFEVKAGSAAGDVQPKGGFEKDPNNDTHWIRNLPAPMQASDFGRPVLQNAAAVDEPQFLQASGVLLSGSLIIATPPQTELADIEIRAFSYHLVGGCSAHRAALTTEVHLSNSLQTPVVLCDVRALEDPLGVFSYRNPPQWRQNDGTIRFALLDVPQQYWDHRYSCRLLIVARTGARLITIRAPAARTESDDNRLFAELVRLISECYAKSDPFWHGTGRLNPRWLIDPPYEAVVLHGWQVRVTGLRPSERVEVLGANERRVAVATANRQGVARISALTSPMTKGSELGLARLSNSSIDASPQRMMSVRGRTGDEQRNAFERIARTISLELGGVHGEDGTSETRGIITRQTLLVERSRVRLPSACRRVGLERIANTTLLSVLADDVAIDFDVSSAARPVAVAALRHRGLAGLVRLCGARFRVGLEGVHEVAPVQAVRSETHSDCRARPARDAVVIGRVLAVLEADGVHVYDRDLCEIGKLERPRAENLLALGRQLVIADCDGLEILDARDPTRLTSLGKVRLPGTRRVRAPAALGGEGLVYVSHAEGGRVLDLSDPCEPAEALRFEGEAWFADAAQLGPLLALPSEDGSEVILYEAVRAELV